MDTIRFDALTRMISSRRVLSSAIAGALTGLLGLAAVHDTDAVACPKSKKWCGNKCINKRRCCTSDQCRPKKSGKVCKRGHCVCPGGTKRCGKRCLLKAAACPPKPDASCLPGSQPISFAPNFRFAQTFTEPNGGRLIAAAIWFRNGSTTTGTYEFVVQSVNQATGVPEGKLLSVVVRSADRISYTTLTWVRFDLPEPVRLLPGRQYALVLTLIGTAGWFTESRLAGECPGGHLFNASLTGSFSPDPLASLPYKTFVKP